MALFTAIGAALGASTTVAAGATVSAAFTTGVVATAAAGAVGYSVFNAMNQPKQKDMGQVQMPAAPSAPKQSDAAALAAQKLQDKKRAMAGSESIMTNPLGLKDEATVARKKLLGG
uniref:Uncharacterized protein n=1 Tax=viral metagenome TaxID=1070528 RepID=A0A6M3L2Q7_9ZZZZ